MWPFPSEVAKVFLDGRNNKMYQMMLLNQKKKNKKKTRTEN